MKAKGRKVGKLRNKKNGSTSMIYGTVGVHPHREPSLVEQERGDAGRTQSPVVGTIKQIVIKHTRTHHRFLTVISETPELPEPTTGDAWVGFRLNLENFSTDTDGEVSHPHNVRKSAKRLRRAQKKLSQKNKVVETGGKLRVRVARDSTNRSRIGEKRFSPQMEPGFMSYRYESYCLLSI
jgi:transposase